MLRLPSTKVLSVVLAKQQYICTLIEKENPEKLLILHHGHLFNGYSGFIEKSTVILIFEKIKLTGMKNLS